MSTASDEEILEAARTSGSVVVTLDADFHMLLAVRHWIQPSVVRIRIEGLKGEELADVVHRAAGAAEPELRAGAAMSVTSSSIRVRRLPLV